MNDAQVRAIHLHLWQLENRIIVLEEKTEFLKGQVRARLKEEADARNLL